MVVALSEKHPLHSNQLMRRSNCSHKLIQKLIPWNLILTVGVYESLYSRQFLLEKLSTYNAPYDIQSTQKSLLQETGH